MDDEDKVINSFDSGQLAEASLMTQTVKNLLAVLETQIRSLDWDDPLENGMVYPLQYSYLENPMDRGAWQAAVHGVAELDTTE